MVLTFRDSRVLSSVISGGEKLLMVAEQRGWAESDQESVSIRKIKKTSFQGPGVCPEREQWASCSRIRLGVFQDLGEGGGGRAGEEGRAAPVGLSGTANIARASWHPGPVLGICAPLL